MANETNELKEVLAKVVGTVRASSALAAQDVEFYSNLDNNIAQSVSQMSNDLLEMINAIIMSVDEHASPLDEGKEQLEGPAWKDYTNMIDNLFEKSDRSIDIINNKKLSQTHSQLNYLDEVAGQSTDNNFNDKRIVKPQLQFQRPIDNTDSHPFKPLLTTKPNALKPLDECLRLVDETEDLPMHYPQPYQYEIDNQEYNNEILQIKDPIPSRPWDEKEAMWIDKKEQLPDLVKDLAQYKELAIDLEHHDQRSYYGIVCLMQISTRDQDYLIDTIALRDDLVILNQVFTDPMITKVFHGAFMDIIWLQRDLGLYIVSLFDSYHASRTLGFPKHSLAYLLETFAHFKTSKKYQLADWRRRPLSKPLINYARADTHFLLNIFDQLRNKLIKENKLASMLKESRNVAKRRFEYIKFRPEIILPNDFTLVGKQNPWRVLMYQYNIPMEREELMEELYQWRDQTARRDDESTGFIMPNQLLVSLVAYTPIDANGVVSVNTFVTDYVRSNSKKIANIIKSYLERVKSKGGNITSTIATTQHSGESDLITLSQIKNMINRYNDLVNKYQTSSNSSETVIAPTDKSKFLGQLNGNNHIIHYEDTPQIVPFTEIQRRSDDFTKHIDELNKIEYTIPAPREETINHITTIDVDHKTINHVPTIEEPVEKEDMNEVIVLKKVKRDFTKTQDNKKDNNNEDEIIDYSKQDKILNSKKSNRQDFSRKRKFDPFSQIHEGPKAAKKRRGGTKGKNVSFKR